MTVKGPKGNLIKVRMPVAKARALAAKRAAARSQKATDASIPKPYRGLVDSKGINDAVTAAIDAAVVPLNAAGSKAQTQRDRNTAASASLNAQTQASLAGAMQNVASGTSLMQQSAAQGATAMQDTNAAAANELRRIMGGSANPALGGMIGEAVAPVSVQNNQAAVTNTFGAGLGGQLQHDFLQRAQGIAAMSQSAFNNSQSQQLADVMSGIAAQIAQVQASRPELVRKYAADEGQFELAVRQQQAEAQAAAAAFGLDEYRAKTDRLDVVTDAQNAADRIAAGGASGARGLSQQQLKAVNEVQKVIDKMRAKIGTVRATEGSGDTKVTNYWTNDTVFGKNNGPFREAFKRLTAANVGVQPGKAAMLVAQWFPDSITRSTPAKLVPMFNRLGVPPAIQKTIMRQNGMSLEAINTALSGQSVYGPPAPKPKPATVSKNEVIQSIKNAPSKVKAGTEFTYLGGKVRFTVQSVEKTISGTTVTMRNQDGRTVQVTVPNTPARS